MEKVTYEELREKIRSLKKYPGTKQIARCPLVTPGFPGAFNMSFGEDPILKEFGKYQFFDHNAAFATIQEVIRHNDLFDGVKNHPEKYLGIFEMSDIFGLIMLKEKVDLVHLQRQQVQATITLLTDIGVELKDVYPKYCGGGTVEKLTKGKYSFDYYIPEDISTRDLLMSAGIPEANIQKDHTRDTLLALNLASGSIGWGYRTEIEVRVGDGLLLDVATIELFLWDPILNESGDIIGLQDITYTLALTVTGVERLYILANSLTDVRSIDHIKRLYELNGTHDSGVEYLRVLHAILSDQEKFGFELGGHRRVYMNRMIRNITMTKEKTQELLKLNATLQPWYPELQDGIEATVRYIEEFGEMRK